MTFDETQKQEIRRKFAELQTKIDLLNLLNYVRPLVFAENDRTRSGKAKDFQLKSLTWYANTTLTADRYRTFSIPKKNGTPRTLHAPTAKLKHLQRCVNALLQCIFDPHEAAMGFVPGKNIADNARSHVNKPYVYNLDLKDFFTSIEFHRVKACLKLRPFNLIGTREPLAFLIANLCCVRDSAQPNRAFLPQGAPTSPTLTNVVCQRLDKLLTGLARRFGAVYTRYADDLTFSSHTNIYKSGGDFCRELERIITDQRFEINPAKTRLQRPGYRQEVTGLIVNERVNVSQEYLREVRQMLHIWKEHGEMDAQARYWKSRRIEPTDPKRPSFRNVVEGKLLYMKMVRGEQDTLFLKYSTLFNGEMNRLPGASEKSAVNGQSAASSSSPSVEQRAATLLEVIELYKKGDIAGAAGLLAIYKKERQLSNGKG